MRNFGGSRHFILVVYLITFCCYGSHLPGEDGAVSRSNHQVGSRRAPPNISQVEAARTSMAGTAYELDSDRRQRVLQAMVEVCKYRIWTLLAAHVRTNHVHGVVAADTSPERIMNAFKSYSSRALRCDGRIWARHGSTLYLWTPDAVSNAVRYVVSKQGSPLAVYLPGGDGE